MCQHNLRRNACSVTYGSPGDRVRVLPNHSCVVSNLVDVVRLVEGDEIVETIPVAARGKIQ